MTIQLFRSRLGINDIPRRFSIASIDSALRSINKSNGSTRSEHRFHSNTHDVNFNHLSIGAVVAAAIPFAIVSHKCQKDPISKRAKVDIDASDYPVSPPPHTDGNDEYILEPEPFETTETIRIDPALTDAFGAHQVNANKIVEDRVVATTIKMSDNKRCYFGAVIDGHGGPHVADYVQRSLGRYVQHFVNKHQLTSSDSDKLAKMLPEVFVALDNDICRIIRTRTDMLYSRTAKIGACCLAVLVTPDKAIIANAGDCEGILGYKKMSKKKPAFSPLAEPHSANLPSEQARLKLEHPGEPDIVRCKRSQTVARIPKKLHEHVLNLFGILGNETLPDVCYVKGRLQPTRCFGDFHLKAEEFAFDHELNRPLVNPPYSFPYITALPEIFQLDLHRRTLLGRKVRAKFLTLACDGVYDFLNHRQVDNAIRSAISCDSNPRQVAEKLVETTLIQASQDNEMTFEELVNLPPDKKRRHHDDTSVLHIDLDAVSKLP